MDNQDNILPTESGISILSEPNKKFELKQKTRNSNYQLLACPKILREHK